MKFKTGLLALLFISSFGAVPISARAQGTDSGMTAIPVENARLVYHRQINKASELYQGGEYQNYPFRFEEGSPYFGGKDSLPGTILYDGIIYKDVFMKYDQVLDAIVIWYKNEAIQPASEKIDYFSRTPQQKASRLPDLRNVLYWNSSLITVAEGIGAASAGDAGSGDAGRRDIEFYSSDLPGPLRGVIQGISARGYPAVAHVYFNIKK